MIRRQAIAISDARPEHRLLIACAVLPMPPDRVGEVRSLLRAGIDWDYMLRIAENHRMTPVLAKHLNSHFAESVPQAMMQELQDFIRQNTYRNLWQTSELHRLLGLFAEQGARALPYKGPLLARFAYGDMACRYLGDLDILIHPSDFQTAQRMLLAERYEPYYRLSDSQTVAYLRYQCESVFHHRTNGFAIDLHWGIRLSHSIFDLEHADLWDRLRPVMLAGKPVLALSPEDSILLLALHGIAHHWRSLNLVMDLGQSVRAYQSAIDWALIWREASRWNIQRILLLALSLANDLTSVEMPPALLSRIEGDSMVKMLVNQIRTELFLPPRETQVWEDLPFHLRIRERRRDQLQCLIKVLTVPSVKEITALTLPPALFPLYRILRPLRLIVKYLIARLEGKNVAGSHLMRGCNQSAQPSRGSQLAVV